MKLSAARDVLPKPLQAVIGVVERRQTMPILSNVLLAARDGKFREKLPLSLSGKSGSKYATHERPLVADCGPLNFPKADTRTAGFGNSGH